MKWLEHCTICPRRCGADRTAGPGFCGGSANPRIARAALHFWEEPCISGTKGSGAVFFSGCSLQCVFCQNYKISAGNFGREVSVETLADIFRRLEAQGAHNINLVTPTHYAPQIARALELARPSIPVVYNCGGYETPETLERMEGLVDIYLPDFKYADNETAALYSHAADYFTVASEAVQTMRRQVPEDIFEENGLMKKGLMIRHLVLPGMVSSSFKILDWVAANLSCSTYISLMRQYFPAGDAENYPPLNRKLKKREYERVVNHLVALGFENGFLQETGSQSGDFVPDFNLTGVIEQESAAK